MLNRNFLSLYKNVICFVIFIITIEIHCHYTLYLKILFVKNVKRELTQLQPNFTCYLLSTKKDNFYDKNKNQYFQLLKILGIGAHVVL